MLPSIENISDFKLSLCSKCCILSSGLFPGIWFSFFTQPPAYEDGTDRVFWNVGMQNSDAGE